MLIEQEMGGMIQNRDGFYVVSDLVPVIIPNEFKILFTLCVPRRDFPA
jgi:hypothetical protein